MPNTPFSRLLQIRIVRFGIVSVLATIVDYAVLIAVRKTLPYQPVYYSIALALGYLAGTIVHFYLSRRLVFKPTRLHIGLEFLLVMLVATIGLVLTEIIAVPLQGYLQSKLPFSDVIAKTVALVVVFCWNYLSRRYLIYHERETTATETPDQPSQPVP